MVSQQSSFSQYFCSSLFCFPKRSQLALPPPPKKKKEGGRKYRVLSSKVRYRNTKRGMLVLQNPEVQVTGTVLFATWNTAKKIHGMHRLCLAKTQESKVSVSCSLHSHWKTITKMHNHNSFNSTVQLV